MNTCNTDSHSTEGASYNVYKQEGAATAQYGLEITFNITECQTLL